MVKFGNQAEVILRTSVIQAKSKDENTLGKKNIPKHFSLLKLIK